MANGDEKVMANLFPMAVKDGARSWLLILPPGSVSSWDEMRDRFVANFQGTRDRPPAAGDLRCIKQQPGETLQKYIQRFNNTGSPRSRTRPSSLRSPTATVTSR